MNATSKTSVAAIFLFFTAASVIVVRRFYGVLPPLAIIASTTLWILAGVCFFMGRKIRRAIDDNMIGFDRSQLGPVSIAGWLAVGRGSILTGAILGGCTFGLVIHLALHLQILAAAANELPAALINLGACLACIVGGFYLEDACQAPPPPAAEQAAAS